MKVEKLDNQARGITYYNDKIMFINNALPDEEIKIKEILEKKKYYEAKIEEITKPSPYRIKPKCPYYNTCGGCNLLHVNQTYEDEYKLEKLESILKKYAGLNIKVKYIPNDKELFYRNKVSLKINNYEWGYYNEESHDFSLINNCLIASLPINEIIKNKDLFKIKEGTITIRSNFQDKILINIMTNENINIDLEKIPSNITGLLINNKCIYGLPYFYDKIADLYFKVSYDSFFQVNNYMASNIFKILRSNLSGENLLDLYCGVGVLGLSLKNNFKNIYGIEKNKQAIVDAKKNASRNKVKNASFYAGDTAKILNTLNIPFDTVIIDPPRSGLNKETIDELLKIKPLKIMYVSCDPITLARDLKRLKDNYKVIKVNGLNMFPKSYHLETVCLLERSD